MFVQLRLLHHKPVLQDAHIFGMLPQPFKILPRFLAKAFQVFAFIIGRRDDLRPSRLEFTLAHADLVDGIHQLTHNMIMQTGGAKSLQGIGRHHNHFGIIHRIPEIMGFHFHG